MAKRSYWAVFTRLSVATTINKVPFLGDIPFAGALFRSTKKIDNKAELLIFVTPRILEEGSSIY